MQTITAEQLENEQALEYQSVRASCTLGSATFKLAQMAIDHGGSGSYAAAKLLLALEDGAPFNFSLLLSFDVQNRAMADILMLGFKPGVFSPAGWMLAENYDGYKVMDAVRQKWSQIK